VRIDYLHAVGSMAVDGNGNAVVTLRPDVGQYWAPKFVRVATTRKASSASITPYCAVYHGAVGQTIPLTFIDDTNLGNGDTSGVISGTVVIPGEGITAQWQNMTPNTTAVMDVYGECYDTPPGIGFAIPETLGPHFFGKNPVPAPWQAASPNGTGIQPILFNNPGPPPGHVDILFAVPGIQIYLQSMQWSWNVGFAGGEGYFGNDAGTLRYVNDVISGIAPRNVDFKGASLRASTGLTWWQTGPGAANSISCQGTVISSSALVLSP
jgi:hypothetical protein